MKKLVFLFVICTACTLVSCSGSKTNEEVSTDLVKIPDGNAMPGSMPVITFAEEKHDFGTITEGEKVSYAFRFKNTGGSDLVITSAKGSCGCTVADPPKKPIRPNGEDVITVTFDSDNRSGINTKEVTVVTNAQPSTKVLQFTVNVMKAEDMPDKK